MGINTLIQGLEQNNMLRKIIYIGDSFCACHWHGDTHINVVRQYFKSHEIITHGYPGSSWFYQRQHFLKDCKDLLTNYRTFISAIIFFHTDNRRINKTYVISHMSDLDPVETSKWFDVDFQQWAQEQWFIELANNYSDIPTIHFHNMVNTLPMADLLPGMQFITPLTTISIGELTGTDDEIMTKLASDNRDNHLSKENNRHIGKLIIDSINNYQPGKFSIDLSKFNLINPNSHKYPNPGFGTR